jgi:hypothetical protein
MEKTISMGGSHGNGYNGVGLEPSALLLTSLLVFCLGGEIEVFGDNLSQWRFVDHKSQAPNRSALDGIYD